MFNNRLEILSHGGLPSGMTKKQFFEGISKPRNRTLMRIFLSMDLSLPAEEQATTLHTPSSRRCSRQVRGETPYTFLKAREKCRALG